MPFLIFDTETTGLISRDFELDHPSQPHIVQLAALLVDEEGNELSEMDVLIKPDGWTISDELVAIHGITTEKCEAEGIPMVEALQRFNEMKQICTARIGYNVSFDKQMMAREAYACKVDHNSDGKETICVMRMVTPIMKMPPTDKMVKSGRNWNKNPKLQEAYTHFFGRSFEKAHSALADVRATKELFFHIRENFPAEYEAYLKKIAEKKAEREAKAAAAAAQTVEKFDTETTSEAA